MKGIVLGDKEQGVGIRDKTEVEFDTEDQVLYLLFSRCLFFVCGENEEEKKICLKKILVKKNKKIKK